MNDVYCPAPWNALYYKDSLKAYKPCCEFEKWTFADSIEEYYNSNLIEELKTNILNGKWHKHCKKCKNTEELGYPSYATMLTEKLGTPDTSKFSLKWLDYRPGNLCNLKCRMCSVVNSNMIEKEALENPIIMEVLPEMDKKLFDIDHKNSELLPELIAPELFDNLLLLKVLGGEPTLDPQVFKLLEYVGTLPPVGNIVLNYTTNATSVNNRWLNATSKFKKVNINFSIDGANETYDYIRTGASYDSVTKNIIKLIEQTVNYGTGRINLCWSNFNALTVDEWANKLIDLANEYNLAITVIDLVYPPHMHTKFLPNTIKEKVNDKISKVKDEKLVKLFRGYMNKESSSSDQIKYNKEFFKYADALDKVRNTDINKISTLYEEWRTQFV